jgi:hypothetical protein
VEALSKNSHYKKFYGTGMAKDMTLYQEIFIG